MKPDFSKTFLVLAVGSSALISACGGGGGGSGSGSASVGQGGVAASSITSSNAKEVGAQAYASADALNSQVGSGSGLVVGVSTETAGASLLDAALQQLYLAAAHRSTNVAVGVTLTETVPCDGGGTASITVNAANPDQLSKGDTISVTGNNCREDGVTMNGTMNVVINSLSGDPSESAAWSGSFGFTFVNFSVNAGGTVNTANGDFTLSYNQTSFNAASFSASGNSLKMRTTKGTSSSDRTLSAYSYSGSVNSANVYTYRANFTLSGTFGTLGNVSYTVKTTTDFRQTPGAFPTAGALVVTASDKSTLTMTVTNGTSVQLAVDRNGDGTVDSTSTATWTELNGLI